MSSILTSLFQRPKIRCSIKVTIEKQNDLQVTY